MDRYRLQNFICAQQFHWCLSGLHVLWTDSRHYKNVISVWSRRACHSALWCLFCLSRPRYLNVAIVRRTELLGIWCGRRREYQIIEAGCLGLESGRVGGRAPLPDRNLSPYHRPAHYQHPDNSKYKYATDKMQWKLIFQDAHSHKTLLLVIRNNIWL